MPPDSDTVGKGLALWVMPQEPATSRLALEISRLSELYSAPQFEPHVTLAGGIQLPEDEALVKAAHLASHLNPFRIELGDIGYLDEYFRCLFVKVNPNDSLLKAHEAACKIFECPNEPSYMPHASLIYGRLPIEAKKRIAAGLSSLPGLAWNATSLTIYRVSGAPHEWKPVKEFTFG